ncbi:AcrB/AcrD/AcrF family protein [marine gamma proteobacterium HTCC2207]|uniref:AcrB/AcrD/AcrF family protein n=1 Tax=gamma proteobacterium HTCC2207 TaxID=314287 RepID=Q1YSR4_9GAMM|nr:AcrB/AcrD/AcrF family protein [marine gamma proteobacterium HTCC2207] [gamma proteobacterium HTCC2207]
MKFLNLIVDHARATLSIMLLVLFAGTMARIALPVEVNPNVTLPLVMIMVRHDGISPEDGTRLLIRPVEKELKTLDGLEEINAVAREGVIYIMTEFDISEDIDKVVSEVREAVDRAKAEFPQDTKEPIVNELSPSPEPTVVITFSGEQASEREIFRTAKFFQRKLEMLPNVLKADISGHRDEVVEAVLDPYRLEQYNITADEMLRSVRGNNLLIPAGEIDAAQGRFGIKVPALIETTDDIRKLPVRFTADGVITLGDVADVRRTFKDASGFSTINGKKTIAIDVRKRLNANAIQTVADVRAAVASYQGQFSQNIDIEYIFDSSEYAQSMVSELQGNILTAMSLVLVLVVATLGVRSGLLVGFGIPFCLLGAMIVIYLLGFSFNFMVMFGLLLSLGMLIDGAIVVVEFANTRASEGLSNREAYLIAVKRMAIPVIASTGTTLAAFLPLLFWPGVAGEFMSYLPITVFAVLGWSLTYALIFAPTLGIVISRRRGKSKKLPEDHGSEESAKNLFQPLLNFYLRTLTPIIARPAISSVVAILLLVSIFFGYGKYGAGQAFFADIENRYGVVNVRAQGNLSVEERRKITAEVEQRISSIEGIQQLYGFSEGNSVTLERDASRDKISSFLVELFPRGQRERGSLEIFAEIRQSTANMPGIYVTGKEVEGGPPVGKDIQIQISSADRELMYKTTAEIRDWIKLNVEGLRDIEDTLPLAGIQWEIVVDRPHAAMLGVNVANVGQMVQMVTNGVMLGEFRPDDADDEVEIRLRYPEQNRQLAALDELRVNTQSGPVPISSFSERVAKPRVDAIQRIDMLETVYILANTEDGYLSDNQTSAISEWLATQDIDDSIKVIFRGANEEQADSAAFLSVAFSLAMSLMLIMLVMQFNSFYQAFLILFSVVMSTAGVMLGLLISQAIFSTILTGVGIVALAGIVVNNNIVLIDSYNFLRRSDPSISAADAVFSAAKSRFRPVMLTTITTVVGLLPLANGYSVDIINRTFEAGGMVSTWWQPLASAIVNGLLLSTILTLLLTPAMLLLPEIISKRFGMRVGSNEFGENA